MTEPQDVLAEREPLDWLRSKLALVTDSIAEVRPEQIDAKTSVGFYRLREWVVTGLRALSLNASTLDATALVRTPETLDALLVEFDGSVCPACHHRAHEPGSCSECPRCELHTDEALAFVMRYEPELLRVLFAASPAPDPGAGRG